MVGILGEGYADRPDPRRVKYMEVTRHALAGLFMEGMHRVTQGVPDDSVVVGVGYNAPKDVYEVMVHSEEFDVIPEGADVPRIDNVYVETVEEDDDGQ